MFESTVLSVYILFEYEQTSTRPISWGLEYVVSPVEW